MTCSVFGHEYRIEKYTHENGGEELPYTSTDFRNDDTSKLTDAKIDLLDFEYVCEGTEQLFEKLLNCGYSGKLLNFLHAQEKSGLDFNPVAPEDHFMKSRIIARSPETKKVAKKLYYSHNPSINVSKIAQYDATFFGMLIHACQNHSFLKITRMDLCVDYTKDFMPFILRDLKRGNYRSHKTQPYAYCLLNGMPYKGSLGKI